MLPIKYLTIHCAATPEGRNVNAETVEAWDRARFNQPSYHWIIELDGNQHRSLQDSVLGAHVAKHNTGNIGICYVGGCDVHMKPKDTRRDAQKKALLALVLNYRRLYPGIKIMGHRDWPGVTKACPSFSVEDWMIEEGI